MGNSDTDAIEAVRAEWPGLFNAGRMDELGEHFYSADVDGVTLETYRRQADRTWKCVVDTWHNSEPD